MIEMIFAFAGVMLMVAIMSIGIIFGRQPIQGSCGGIGADGTLQPCTQCGSTSDGCTEAKQGRAPAELPVD